MDDTQQDQTQDATPEEQPAEETPTQTDAELAAGRRQQVEDKYAVLRSQREEQYRHDKETLEAVYRDDLQTLAQNREAAMDMVGLNPDGSDPQGRPQGTPRPTD
jgi:hypothetical protein